MEYIGNVMKPIDEISNNMMEPLCVKQEVHIEENSMYQESGNVVHSSLLKEEMKLKDQNIMPFQFIEDENMTDMKKEYTEETNPGLAYNLQVTNEMAPDKEASPILSMLLTKLTGDVDLLLDDSLDGRPPSVESGYIPTSNENTPSSSTSIPVSLKRVHDKKKANKKYVVSAYILYSSKARKQAVLSNPGSTFGEISRIVGSEWRSLPAEEKQAWEEKAQKCNEENAAVRAAKMLIIDGEQCHSPSPSMLQLAPLHDQDASHLDMLFDESLDGSPSVGLGVIRSPNRNIATCSIPKSGSLKKRVHAKKKANKKYVVSAYILYSSAVRKQVAQNNPGSSFGEISQIVGNEWRSLPPGEKQAWEEKAQKCNEENAAKLLLLDAEQTHSPAPPILQLAPLPDQIYECLWNNCDYRFEEITDCIDHCIQMHFLNISSAEADYQCQWNGCVHMKENMPRFPTLHHLARHVREVHIYKGNGNIILPPDRI